MRKRRDGENVMLTVVDYLSCYPDKKLPFKSKAPEIFGQRIHIVHDKRDKIVNFVSN